MMNEIDIDMEELEAHLYGQVHYINESGSNIKTSNEPTSTTTTNTYNNQPLPLFTNLQPLPHVYTQSPVVVPNLYSQLGVILNPSASNNIVVIQQPPHQVFSNTFELLRLKESHRRKRKLYKQKKKNYIERFRGFNKHYLTTNIIKEHEANTNNKSTHTSAQLKPNVVVISDDESVDIKQNVTFTAENTIDDNNSDDVVFVETKQDEVINIDCDDPIESDSGSTVATDQNDFLEDTMLNNKVEILPTNPSNLQIANNLEVSDSESSTTSDSQNCNVFGEHAFDTPCNATVSALNLDDFENYISSGKFVTHSSAVQSTAVTGGNKCDKLTMDSSDSSSESDYHDYVSVAGHSSNMKLPELSPIVSDYDIVIPKAFDGDVISVVDATVLEGDNISVVSIDSSDGLSDVEVCMDNGIELLNIEGSTEILPQKLDNSRYDVTVVGNTKTAFANFWTEDMKKFYNESWGQEEYDCKEEQKKMSDDPNMWKIIDEDRNFTVESHKLKCHRCRQNGHKALNCPNKSGVPKCILCGYNGHQESRCPNKLCNACGENIPYWTLYCRKCTNICYAFCKICSLRGHTASHCSDLWKRYHLTVEEGPIVRPERRSFKLSEDRWCCTCASQGHYEHECNYTIKNYPPTTPFVHSYEDVYNSLNQVENQNNVSNPIPNVVDMTVHQNNTMQNRKFNWSLNYSEASILLNNHGVAFLKSISKNTDLRIQIRKCGTGLKNHLCIIKGSYCHTFEAKRKIQEYIRSQIETKQNSLVGLLNTNVLSRGRLRDNLKVLKSKMPWRKLIVNTYKTIQKCEEEIAKNPTPSVQSKKALKNNYMALNAVLMNKLNVGKQEKLQLLKYWLDGKDNFAHQTIQSAYDHVFRNGTRAKIDYKHVINTLPQEIDNPFITFKRQIDFMLKSCVQICKRMNFQKELRLLHDHHNAMVQSNYSAKCVNAFKKVCNGVEMRIRF